MTLSFPTYGRDLTVFFIHGFNSTSADFCETPQAVRLYFARKGINLKTAFLTYNTYQDTKSPYDFTKDITRQIQDYYEKNNLDKDSPYSFVVHSQGGIVALKYLQHELNSCFEPISKQTKSPTYRLKPNCHVPHNFQDLITLGTPFWGSQGANASSDGLIYLGMKHFSGVYKQLEQLRIGSIGLGNNRNFMLSRIDENGWHSPFQSENLYRIHNLAGNSFAYLDHGVNSVDRFVKKWTGTSGQDYLLGTEQQESDFLVSPSSARADFNYVVQKTQNAPILTGQTNIGTTYYSAPQPHLDLDYFKINMKNRFDNLDARLPMACKKGEEMSLSPSSTHYSFRYILSVFDHYFDNFSKHATPETSALKLPHHLNSQGLQNFLVDMQIFPPLEIKRRPRIQLSDITIEAQEPEKIEATKLQSGILLRSTGFNKDSSLSLNKNFISFHHDGRFKLSDQGCCVYFPRQNTKPPGTKLNYTIDMVGFEKVELEVPINISLSTFVKFYLKPYRPIKKQLLRSRFSQKTYGLFAEGDYITHISYSDNQWHLSVVQTQSGQFKIISLTSEELEQALSHQENASFLAGREQSKNSCHLGLTAESVVKQQNKTKHFQATFMYKSPIDQERSQILDLGTKVKILGRYNHSSGASATQTSIDRYLVLIPHRSEFKNRPVDVLKYGKPLSLAPLSRKGKKLPGIKGTLTWVDVNDIDIIKDEACQL